MRPQDMTESVKVAIKKEGSDLSKGDKDGVFAEWQKRKQSIAPMQSGAQLSSRRKSNLKDLAAHLNMTRTPGMGLRRLTLSMSMRGKSELSADNFGQTKVKQENTYKMKPDENVKLTCPKIKSAVETLLQDELGDFGYEQDFASKLTCDLSDKIKDTVKELGFNRHKIAVNVMVGQAADQGMEVASRCVWDDKNDNSVCVTFSHKDLFVVALVFGAYFE
ncbi:dynein light chain Tctex-type protein 2B-like [Mya arenaria]|uniref:dynein light chain Tctex-type protein 2B-like n=1 Tax=Mya arenaria TaxID=6604 RepID=UPI0022E5B8E9|nr:dynein light chain Tctex-type protein 2B-like [Mya arenaria]